MTLIDANAILRYTLNDNLDMASKIRDLLIKSKVFIRYEVLAEVVYVLNKVYSMSKIEIAEGIKVFLSHPNVETEAVEVMSLALETYKSFNLDFVDCILYAFKCAGCDVFTFDKKLNSMMNKINI
ncbi:MAG: PIN domain-containing protein [Oscillospiraceae bacterium]|nr:PIN domain-containing protein [Oscillospiraceae bacterium]